MHNIDLKKYEVRTDLAIDLINYAKSSYIEESYSIDDINITWINLKENNNLNKKPGRYLTIEFGDITDTDSKNKVGSVFTKELKKMLKLFSADKTKKILVVGLGNDKSTPDSLGPLVADKIIVTSHLFESGETVDSSFSNVTAITPGVTGVTGIETSDFIKAIVNQTKPNILMVVDALASSSISRVNKSIQVTDSGIFPGSGIGNKRKEISKETIGIPVLSIGIPTVVDATTIVSDTINFLLKSYSFNKNLEKKKISKLINKTVNILNKKVDVEVEDKKTFLGLVGALSEQEVKELVFEVLTPMGYNFMVTPKEIDFIIEKLSDIISYGINHSIHDI